MKTAGWGALALVATLGAGWLLGASGRSSTEVALGRAEQRADFLRVRALVLEGRVGLFLNNFGNAERLFTEAGQVVESLQTRLREAGLAERAGQLEIVLAHLGDAQRLAASLDPAAQAAAQAAIETLDSIGGA